MQNEMNKTCAVCNEGKGPTKCEICGFSDGGFINRRFSNYEDLNSWLYAVVTPYRIQWEKRRESESLAKLGEVLAKLEEVKYSSFTDPRDGKVYKTVKIGDQTWMAENLNYKMSLGAKICRWGQENGEYGMLYDWTNAIEACPPGWHLPTKEEWDVLIQAVGGKDTAGKHLKAKSGWKDYTIKLNDCKIKKSGNGENTCGFAALPGGFEILSNDNSVPPGGFGCWWSASEYDIGWWSKRKAYNLLISSKNEDLSTDNDFKNSLFSVRCVQSTPSYIPKKYNSFHSFSEAMFILFLSMLPILVVGIMFLLDSCGLLQK